MTTTSHVYLAELTDTFGGELNYSWVTRFIVHASSPLSAIRKVGRCTGLRFRKTEDHSDWLRYDSRSGATAVTLEPYYPEAHDALVIRETL